MTFTLGDAITGVLLDILISPLVPPWTFESRKQLKMWPRRACLDEIIELVRLAGMLPFLDAKKIYLRPTGVKSAHPAANAQKQEFRHVPKIKTDTPSIRAAIFADFIPDEIGFIGEPPGGHDIQAILKQCVWNP